MGDLVKMPYSEVTATLETLDRLGVKPDHLAKFRKSSGYIRSMIAQALIRCDESLFAGHQVTHRIDCDAPPFIPNGWRVEEHTQGGIFTWDSTRVELYLSERQKGSKHISGTGLREELKSQQMLNANVLDYLLTCPELIPKRWIGKTVFFLGTVYRDSRGYLYVRCLFWSGDYWDWHDLWLGSGFNSNNPAAVRVS